MNAALTPQRATRIVVIALFAAAVITAGIFTNLKRLALAYDPIDYSFYAQFAAKLLDPQLSKRFSAQPDGYNFLGYYGTEGVYSFHQSLHLEPVKYLYALVFWIGKMPLAMYILIATLYFLPVLYLLAIHKIEQPEDVAFVLLFTLSYVTYPAVLATIAYDLRPRILFVPFLTLSVLSVIYRRPFIEKVILISALFLAREEALLFAAVVIAMNFCSAGDRRKTLIETGVFVLLSSGYFLLMSMYFKWTGYGTERSSMVEALPSLVPYLAASAAMLVLIAAPGILLWKKTKLKLLALFQLLAFTSMVIPLSVQLKTEVDKWKLAGGNLLQVAAQRFLFSEKVILYFIVMLLFVTILWHLTEAPQKQKVFHAVWAVLVGLLLITSLVRNAGLFQLYQNQITNADIVFKTVQGANPYQTHVLTDEKTYQAFYNYEHAILYSRLPWSLAQEQRFFPENLPALRLLLPQVEYVVISRNSDKDVLALLAAENMRFSVVDENEQYSVLKVVR